MDRGSYITASSGLLQLRKLDVVTNNIANVDTPGFKKQLIVGETQNFNETFAKLIEKKDPYAKGDHARSPGVAHIKTATDFSVGAIKNTTNPLDVALRNPDEFFAINTANGTEYTRAGNFTMNSEGNLVTVDGYEVQGDGGPINIQGINPTISSGGIVRVNGAEAGQLQVVKIENPDEMERKGSTRFAIKKDSKSSALPVTPDLVPQSLEMSNTSVITSMVDMITTNRAFELYTKVAQSIDGMNQVAITQVGKAR